MISNSAKNNNDYPANPELPVFIMIFLLILSILQVSCIRAQNRPESRDLFDAFQFYTPEGFKPAYEGLTLALNSNPEISYCSFVFMATQNGSDDPQNNFEDSWKTLIAPALAGGSTERKTLKDDRDGWKGFAGSTIATFDKLKLQLDLHTYTRNNRYVSVMFFFESDKCESVHKQFLQNLSLADDASQNGPPAKDYYVTGDPGFLSREPLTGVWTLMQKDSTDYFAHAGEGNFITFLDNGDMFKGLMPYGSFHTDRQKMKKDAAINYKCGKYTFSPDGGIITIPADNGEPVEFTLINDTILLLDDKKFVKSTSVSGYRLEGAWATDFSRFSNRLTLSLVNRFTDDGIFQSLHDVNPWLFADEKGGQGKYQIYDHTIYLQYDDGRARTLSFAGAAPYDLRETNSLMMIGAYPFKKLSTEMITY
jgi:hypothetical protein